jgi:hypothetical protein
MLVSNWRDRREANYYVDKLCGTGKPGLDLALGDIDVFGGQTEGWSEAIVIGHPLRKEAISALAGRAEMGQTRSGRIGAALLLVRIEPKSENALIALRVLRDPGRNEVDIGRRRLCLLFEDAKAAFSLLYERGEKSLDVTDQDFERFLRDHKLRQE